MSYGYTPYPAPPPAPRNNNSLILGCGVLAVVATVFSGCGLLLAVAKDDTATPRKSPVAATPRPTKSRVAIKPAEEPTSAQPTASEEPAHTVIYKVSGPAAGLVTYTKPNGSISQDSGARLPWAKTVTTDKDITFLSVNAQNKSAAGKIACSISVDGKVVDQNTSSGAYAVVSCQYSGF